MTPSQQKTVDQLRSEIARLHSLGQAAKYEFKKFEVIEQGNLVFVVAEYGRYKNYRRKVREKVQKILDLEI